MLATGPPGNKGIQVGWPKWSTGKYAPFELKLGTFLCQRPCQQCPDNFSPIRALFYACNWATWEQRNPRWRPKWSTGKYAPFELKLCTFLVNVHVRMPR